jgi:hypothetical protein
MLGGCAAGAGETPAPVESGIPQMDAALESAPAEVGMDVGPEVAIEAPAPVQDAPSEPAPATKTCATMALCDDFESAAGQPDPARWTVGAPNVTGTGALAVDDTQAHSGTRSIKVTGQGGYSNHIFLTNAGSIARIGPLVWGRFYVRLSGELGDGHVTFVAMKDAHDGGKYLRMGGQGKILMWNRESDDATVPALSPTGIAQSRPLPTDRWLCLEFMVDGAQGQLRTWVDGAEVAGTHVDGTSTPDIDEQWLRKTDWRPMLIDFALGWESYAGQAMTLWFDDVALDGARVGCL